MVAIALQAAALRRDRVTWFGTPDADHADLGVVLKGTFLFGGCAVRELPDAYAVVPAAPVVDHGAVPGRACRDNGDQYPARYEQCSCVGDDAVLGALAVLEEVGRVRKHQAHAAFGDAHAFKGAGDKLGL